MPRKSKKGNTGSKRTGGFDKPTTRSSASSIQQDQEPNNEDCGGVGKRCVTQQKRSPNDQQDASSRIDKIIESLQNDVKAALVLVDKERNNLNDRITALRAKLGTTGFPLSSEVVAQDYFKLPLRNEKHFVAENLGSFAFDANCKLFNETSNPDGECGTLPN